MNKISDALVKRLMPIGNKVNQIRFLNVIRSAMVPTVPLIICGSLVLII